MFYSSPIEKIRITKDNIGKFYYHDKRVARPDYIADRKALEKKMIAYEKWEVDDLTKKYPERYDLNVLTYNQYTSPYLIIDGCHRIEGMKRMLEEGRIEGFNFWLIPSNILGAETEEDAYRLRDMVDKELDEVGLPHWVNKFYYVSINDKLVAWKNINIIDTGDTNQPLQFGVDWKLNIQSIDFALNKELKDLPKWKDLT
jgi:glutaredoxin